MTSITELEERQYEAFVAEQRKDRYLKTDEQKQEYKTKKREYMRRYRAANPEKTRQQSKEAQRRFRQRMR